jgi:hypothetical protein
VSCCVMVADKACSGRGICLVMERYASQTWLCSAAVPLALTVESYMLGQLRARATGAVQRLKRSLWPAVAIGCMLREGPRGDYSVTARREWRTRRGMLVCLYVKARCFLTL